MTSPDESQGAALGPILFSLYMLLFVLITEWSRFVFFFLILKLSHIRNTSRCLRLLQHHMDTRMQKAT